MSIVVTSTPPSALVPAGAQNASATGAVDPRSNSNANAGSASGGMATNASAPVPPLDASSPGKMAAAHLTQARQNAAVQTGGLSSLMADLSQAMQLHGDALPPSVQKAIGQLFTLQLSSDSPPSAEDLKSALDRSGLFTESRFASQLAEPSGGNSSTTSVPADIKSLLLVLRQSLNRWVDELGPATAQTSSQAAESAGPAAPSGYGASASPQLTGSTPDVAVLNSNMTTSSSSGSGAAADQTSQTSTAVTAAPAQDAAANPAATGQAGKQSPATAPSGGESASTSTTANAAAGQTSAPSPSPSSSQASTTSSVPATQSETLPANTPISGTTTPSATTISPQTASTTVAASAPPTIAPASVTSPATPVVPGAAAETLPATSVGAGGVAPFSGTSASAVPLVASGQLIGSAALLAATAVAEMADGTVAGPVTTSNLVTPGTATTAYGAASFGQSASSSTPQVIENAALNMAANPGGQVLAAGPVASDGAAQPGGAPVISPETSPIGVGASALPNVPTLALPSSDQASAGPVAPPVSSAGAQGTVTPSGTNSSGATLSSAASAVQTAAQTVSAQTATLAGAASNGVAGAGLAELGGASAPGTSVPPPLASSGAAPAAAATGQPAAADEKALAPPVISAAADAEKAALLQSARAQAAQTAEADELAALFSDPRFAAQAAVAALSNAGVTMPMARAFTAVDALAAFFLQQTADATDEASTDSGTPPPFKGGPTTAQSASTSSLPDDADLATVARHLLSGSEAALAHQKLLQMASLPDSEQTSQTSQNHWMFEIPLATPQGTAVAQFAIDHDGGGENGGEESLPVWRVRFAVAVEPLGPVQAQLALSGGRTWVTLWASRPASLERLRAGADDLSDALADAALESEIAFHPVVVPKKAGSGRFLDHTS